ncbi:unnamed protein product [Paramecium sonneborni]|uniref:Uncharacterized protein n=1 Tax=Paramecium sonneborni TaxID=65129 RepID=A0A8S1QVA3_9CILI|nr:unnamed protein product [Paramecium sonneborni]
MVPPFYQKKRINSLSLVIRISYIGVQPSQSIGLILT